MAYNCRGQLASRTNADGSTITHQYNLDDELTRTVDERGNIFNFTKDDQGRVTQVSISRVSGVEGTTIQSFRYNGIGNETMLFDNNDPSNSDDDSTITRVYDSVGRIVEESQNGELVSHGYKSFVDGPIETIYPDDSVADYEYDSFDRETAITYNDSEVVQKVYLGQEKRLVQTTLGGTILANRTDDSGQLGYDEAQRPTYLSYRPIANPSERILEYRSYYDRAGNLTKETTDSVVTQNYRKEYTYDENDKMVAFMSGIFDPIEGPVSVINDEWVLDGVGNRVQMIYGSGDTKDYVTNEMNQYTSAGDIVYTYDESGNLETAAGLTDTGVQRTEQFTWDAFKRLIRYSRVNGSADPLVTTYRYDAENRRIRKARGSETTLYRYRDHDVISEITVVSGDPTVTIRDFNYILGEEIDTSYGFVDKQSGASYFYLKDQLNSVGGIVDGNGSPVEFYTYGPYGHVTVKDSNGQWHDDISTIDNTTFFQSREFDRESDLYYFRAREFSPVIGRFISVDPLTFDNILNQYSFVNNNPGTYSDPTGKQMHQPTIKHCSAFEDSDITEYDMVYAENFAKNARKYTHKSNKVYRNCKKDPKKNKAKPEFHEFFGCAGSTHFGKRRHWAHVERIVRRINREWEYGRRFYHCVDKAYRAKGFPFFMRYIRIGNHFWTDDSNRSLNWKRARRSRTLVHETAHKKGAVLLNKNERYDVPDCTDYAADNPKKAKENADNYALFGEKLTNGFTVR